MPKSNPKSDPANRRKIPLGSPANPYHVPMNVHADISLNSWWMGEGDVVYAATNSGALTLTAPKGKRLRVVISGGGELETDCIVVRTKDK